MDWSLPERFTYQGHRIAWGSIGSGPPAVLVHGFPFSSLVWRRIAPHLARHRKVFYYDLLGFGQSDRPNEDVLHGALNGVLTALVHHWAISPPDVVGHDFGGLATLRAHLLDQIDYRCLMLFDSMAISPQGSTLIQAARAHQDVFTGLAAYLHEAIARAYLGQTVERPLPEQVLQLYLGPLLGPEGQGNFWRQIAQMDDRYSQEIEQRYGEVRCPVRILWAENDDFIPLKDGQELARRIGQGPLIPIPDAKHLLQEDAPEAIIANILDFWSTQDCRSAAGS